MGMFVGTDAYRGVANGTLKNKVSASFDSISKSQRHCDESQNLVLFHVFVRLGLPSSLYFLKT